jgi:hypothetical protein
MVETEAVMEKIYRVIEIPPDPPFSKGGNVLLFSETCRHAAEDSLRISPPFTKGGPGGDLTIGQRKPQISPPFVKPQISPSSAKAKISPPLPKGAGGIFTAGK